MFSIISSCICFLVSFLNVTLIILFSHSEAASIINSYSDSTVSGNTYVGGLVGDTDSSITNSYASGSVEGVSYVGGLVGDTNSSITSSYASGSGEGVSRVGGLVGASDYGSIISDSYTTGEVTGTGDYTGGLVGHAGGTITRCYSSSKVDGNTYTGGLVGTLVNVNISNLYYH